MSSTDKPASWLPTLCLDFDGVIHAYRDGWRDGSIYDSPVPGTGEALLRFMTRYRVVILSSRSRSWRGRRAMRAYVDRIVVDAVVARPDLAQSAWAVQRRTSLAWPPWTGLDIQEQAHEIAATIRYPWFKPAAFLTIDDRALTFTGDWQDFDPDTLRAFRPWNQYPKWNRKERST